MQVEYKQLEVWLHGKLKPLCVADPIPLSQYVIALIKKDKGEQELKEICMDQLEVFLQENTTKFVEDLFTALKSRSYVSNEPSKSAQSSSSGPKEVSGKPHSGNHSFDNVPKDRKRNLSNSNPPSLTDSSSAKQKRKRSPEVKSKRISPGRSRSPHSSSRSINNTIIAGRQHGDSWNRGRHNDQMGESNLKTVDSHNRRNSSGGSDGETSHLNTHSRRNKHRDSESQSRDSRERINSRNRDEHNSRLGKSATRSSPDSRINDEKFRGLSNRRCRDFEERGFCVYGDKCQYNHGPNALVISSAKSASVTTHLTNPLLDPKSLSTNILDSSMNIIRESSKSSVVQPQSIVTAVLSGQTNLNDLSQQIVPSCIPVYHPTPINQQDSQMLMACCVDQSRDTGLLSQIANPPSILYNNNNHHNNNANNTNNKGNWRNSRLPSHAQQQRYNNHRTAGNSVSRNIVTLPMVENVNSSETTLHQSVVNSAAAAPPAYEPDRPHLSMISTSDSIVPAAYDDDVNDVEHTTGSATAATPPLSYTPSPITEQISSYAVVPKTCEISNLSLDTVTSRTVDPRTVLYVNRLPWRFNDENKIREHFAQFGNVINVVARYRGLADTAMVEFSSSDEAEKAYRSPVPMFSNRFIRIFTRLPENFQQNARNTNRRFPRPKSVLDRLGSRPMLDTNNKVNSYAWMNMNHDSVDNQQVAHETLPPNDTLHRGNRSRWRLERNPASGDALLSGDEEDDMADENPVTDFSGTSNFVKVSNKMDHNDNKFADNFLDYNSDQDTSNLDVHKYQSRNMNIASSPYTLSLKQEADAISWERRKMAALKQRKEQLMILDKSREARESAIEVQKQRVVRIKLLLKRVMDQLENNRTNDIGSVTDSSKPLTLDERKKLLVEAKRLQSELESAIEAEKKALANHTSLKETNSKKTKGSTTISAAALQALPAAVRMEREKQISEIQDEIDKAETALREMPQDSEKIKESRRRIVELKRQLVELETIRPSDILAPQTAAGFAAADGSVYPNRTQTKLDKRPRTLYITGIEADDVENFQNALSMNYLHTQSFTKLTDPGTDQLVLEVTFCTRDFAEAAIRQFSQFHGRDLHMSFVYPPMVPDSKSSSFSEDDVKHVSSTQAETSDQLQAITSSESLDYSSHSSPTSTTALNMISL
ncbi:unnamed protein product [Trichobilharzia szidati]|nr:unnamed protein product [Trichobilharzia szidati]